MTEIQVLKKYYKYRKIVTYLKKRLSEGTTKHYTTIHTMNPNPNKVFKDGRTYTKIYPKAN